MQRPMRPPKHLPEVVQCVEEGQAVDPDVVLVQLHCRQAIKDHPDTPSCFAHWYVGGVHQGCAASNEACEARLWVEKHSQLRCC
jgi:hypothetical protein